jgi:hypothetical protein
VGRFPNQSSVERRKRLARLSASAVNRLIGNYTARYVSPGLNDLELDLPGPRRLPPPSP